MVPHLDSLLLNLAFAQTVFEPKPNDVQRFLYIGIIVFYLMVKSRALQELLTFAPLTVVARPLKTSCSLSGTGRPFVGIKQLSTRC